MRLPIAAFSLLLSFQLSLAQSRDTAPPFVEVVNGAFSKWDLNHDGELTLEEVNRAVVNQSVKGHEAAAVAALRRGMRSTKGELPKVTLAELKTQSGQKGTANGHPDWNALYKSAHERISTANRELFPKGKPTLEAVSQGRMGDCFCLAPLGAICHRDPAEIVKMIRLKQDGTYSMQIGTDAVIVSAPTDAEIALSGRARDDGIWVNVYEKAVGEWRMRKLPEKERPVTSLDLLTKGGSAGTMLAAVTGHAIERVSLAPFKGDKVAESDREKRLGEIRVQLEKAFAQSRCVTTGTGATLPIKTPNINANHAYAVLGYNRTSDRLLIWNPHGQAFKPKGSEGLTEGYETTHGQFRIPLSDFVRLFSGLAFEIKPMSPDGRR